MKREKHEPFKEGKRTHVERYILDNGKGIIRCSEPNCELNEDERE